VRSDSFGELVVTRMGMLQTLKCIGLLRHVNTSVCDQRSGRA
jgi:hypothetical protein